MASREDLIKRYFHSGYSYSLIACFLHFIHGITISLRQLKRILNRLNLKRRYPVTLDNIKRAESLIRVCNSSKLAIASSLFCKDELSLLGYHSMWRRLQSNHGFHIPRFVFL